MSSVIDNLERSGFFEGYTKIYWWSDTGPNHFRTSNTLFYFRQFQQRTQIEMVICFFAPYHGHSKCDGHIGAVSRKLTKNAQELQGTLGVWDKQFVENNILELSFTTLTHHGMVRTPKVVRTLEGIKKFLVFTFDTLDPLKADTVNCQSMCGGDVEVLSFLKLNVGEKEDVDLNENDEEMFDPNCA